MLKLLLKIIPKVERNACLQAKAGLLEQFKTKDGYRFWRAEDDIYDSAADYAGEKGLLDVIVIK
jgi:hypothetical protein